MRARLFLALTILGVSGCQWAVLVSTTDMAVGYNFRLVIEQVQATSGGVEVVSAVTSTARQDFYANVGDAINAASEQSTIFAAAGTHAVIERRASGTVWESVSASPLDEGARFVVLKAGGKYKLVGDIAKVPGTYRIRLDYFTRNNDPKATALHDYSPTFQVR